MSRLRKKKNYLAFQIMKKFNTSITYHSIPSFLLFNPKVALIQIPSFLCIYLYFILPYKCRSCKSLKLTAASPSFTNNK